MVEQSRLDCWAEWLIRTRFRNESPEKVTEALVYLANVRDRVLEIARLHGGEVVLDVGAGTGLLTFGALEQADNSGHVIALDISPDCLFELRRLAQEGGNARQLSHVAGDGIALPLADASVAVVVTRSVLIYIHNKAQAATEFFRVLRPGGCFSVFEPIN